MPPAKKPTNGITHHPTMATAVAAAQLQMSNATKNAKNPHFRNDYADLSAVRDIVIPAYASNGVACVSEVIGRDGYAGVRTTLYWQGNPDKPRETMPGGDIMIPIGNGRNVPQEIGGISSYFRRYTTSAVGGIAQVDDDAQSIQAPKPKPRQVQQRQQQPQRKERPGPKWEKGPPCPDCAKPANVDINYRAWFKAQDNLPDDVKNRPALWCDDWKACGWKLWTTDEAQTFIQQASASTFDDGLTAAGGA